MTSKIETTDQPQKLLWLKKTIGPLFLMLACPPAAFIFWYTSVYLDGSFYQLWQLMLQDGIFTTIYNICAPHFFGSTTAWTIVGVFAGFEIILMKYLPGKVFHGPITPAGNIPEYKANGVLAYVTTLATFCLCSFQLNLFSPAIIYDHLGDIIGTLNTASLIFCLFLLIKGHVAPSTDDSGSSGNIVFDYYWGMELYPRIFGFDLKQFTNCRFGMMAWPIVLISFAAKQSEVYGLSNSMLVAVAIQLVYISKFFIWETGYLGSMDIMHDRAGYYICWGCLVWVPSMYTSPTLYLVNHPNHLSTGLAVFIFVAGTVCVMINYFADRQRQKVRASNGDCTVWGKQPDLTLANYVTEKGEKKQNVLLSSGWWGISRHFHYIPEILAAFFWSVPALFDNFLPYFYVVFLVVLLVNRAFRDDERCATKYGKDWNTYCNKVPYKLVPYVI
ncbi:MAG TPA: 7-dehydrocholesterol reductase [Parachlamydiaceae bacterium]|nr:7-dehydrocholesterol reductase [Parachlamydiaceae bacterium]